MAKVKKITLIGPVVPYRGGIAQYTTELHKAFKRDNNIKIQAISFKRLYPSWIYPGEGDKEESISNLSDVEYLIDTYNPLSLLAAIKKIPEDTDLVIINWWTLFWQPGMAVLSIGLKRKGIRTVFLCHNLFDHSSKGIKTSVPKVLLKTSANYIVHSKELQQQLMGINKDSKVMLRLHPIYNQFPSADVEFEKRGRLEVLFFGFIRPYKGLDDLLKAVELAGRDDVYLTISGEVWGDKEDLIKKINSYDIKNIDLNLKYSDEQSVANMFERADIVILPYRSATGSGVVALAYNYGKPVLSTNVGGLKEAIIPGRTGWLVPPNSPEDIAKIISVITREETMKMRRSVEKFCEENSWDNFAKAIIDKFI